MSDAMNSHATAIIERCKAGDIWGADLFTVADHAKALAAELAEATARAERLRAMADAYAEVARHAMFSDVPRDVWAAAGRASADCLKHHDLDVAPGDTDNQEAHPMDTLNDHAARISARIEEYRTLDLIGRNSADDLQHHLRALAAERDEANARAERWKRLAEGWEDDFREQMMEAPSGFVETTILEMRREHLLPTDLDGAPGDTAGGLMDRRNRPDV